MRVIYVHTSAAAKLFKEEPESAALETWPAACREAEAWLADSALLRLTPALCDRAGELSPGTRLRSLDALHTAAALSLMPALVAFVAYDERLADTAQRAGLPVASPV